MSAKKTKHKPCKAELASKTVGAKIKKHTPCKVELTSSTVIEQNLLARLAGGASVAVLLTEKDLKLFIEALDCLVTNTQNKVAIGFSKDLKQLRDNVFPNVERN